MKKTHFTNIIYFGILFKMKNIDCTSSQKTDHIYAESETVTLNIKTNKTSQNGIFSPNMGVLSLSFIYFYKIRRTLRQTERKII